MRLYQYKWCSVCDKYTNHEVTHCPRAIKCEDCGDLFKRTLMVAFPLCEPCLDLREREGDCVEDLIAEFEGGLPY